MNKEQLLETLKEIISTDHNAPEYQEKLRNAVDEYLGIKRTFEPETNVTCEEHEICSTTEEAGIEEIFPHIVKLFDECKDFILTRQLYSINIYKAQKQDGIARLCFVMKMTQK